MKAGEIVLFKFPQTDNIEGKLRPALIIKRLPGVYNDWLICMISTKKYQYQADFDEVILKNSNEFKQSGLKAESVIRATRLAVVNEDILIGSIGFISNKLLDKICMNLSDWLNPPKK